jgi:hypothetical protein
LRKLPIPAYKNYPPDHVVKFSVDERICSTIFVQYPRLYVRAQVMLQSIFLYCTTRFHLLLTICLMASGFLAFLLFFFQRAQKHISIQVHFPHASNARAMRINPQNQPRGHHRCSPARFPGNLDCPVQTVYVSSIGPLPLSAGGANGRPQQM